MTAALAQVTATHAQETAVVARVTAVLARVTAAHEQMTTHASDGRTGDGHYVDAALFESEACQYKL